MSDLFEKARTVRENAHAPYSKFKVGAALRTVSGKEFIGCNVENSAYPQGTCAEAGAIAAMIASGEKEILEICIVADSPSPVSPCGGCRQKLAEFSQPSTQVTLANLHGILERHTLEDLLPRSFSSDHLPGG
ncbi:MAG: cytidine deaminase [Verrucomicrobiota bacterium]|nr:cytidine deaminase [Verrucomicrobiota bacterium]